MLPMSVVGWICLAQIPEVEHCLPNTNNRVNGTKSKFHLPAFLAVPKKPASRGFVDELTEEQMQCLIAVYISSSCEVKKAMLACRNVVGEWECLAQIPEMDHCLI